MFPHPHDAVLGDAHHPHRQLLQDLDLMARARFPLIYLVSAEEELADAVLQQLAQLSNPPRKLLIWDLVRGWRDNSADKGSVMGALGRVGKGDANEAALFVLRDLPLGETAPWRPSPNPKSRP